MSIPTDSAGDHSESPGDTCLPTTAWFLYDQNGNPLGQIYRQGPPEVGAQIDAGVVTDFQELRPTCANRRFRVVVRMEG